MAYDDAELGASEFWVGYECEDEDQLCIDVLTWTMTKQGGAWRDQQKSHSSTKNQYEL